MFKIWVVLVFILISEFIDILGFEGTYRIHPLGIVNRRRKDGKLVTPIVSVTMQNTQILNT